MHEPGGGTEPSERASVGSTDEPRTRGFLFCDLRGYTAFVEAHGDRAAADLLERYRVIVRAAVARAAGAEIRTEGDSFYVVFPSASPAVRCGLDIVAAAASASLDVPDRPIRVGVGIHAGESVEQAEGYVGSAVNIAARVCAMAGPGEVLVTDIVRGLVRTSLDVTFTPRGRPRLKGIAEPIALYRVSSGTTPVKQTRSRAGRPAIAGVAVMAAVLLVIGAAAVARPWLAGGGGGASPSLSLASSSAASSAQSSVSPSASSAPEPGGSTAPLTGQLAFIATQQVGTDFYPRQQLYVAGADGRDRKRISELTGGAVLADWSADGRRLVYFAGGGEGGFGAPRIVEVATAPTFQPWPGPWQPPNGTFTWEGETYYPDDLAWSPSGDLVLSAGPGTVSRIFAIADDGSDLRMVTEPDPAIEGDTVDDRGPSVSPDGLTVAFLSNRSVWAAALDGSGRIQVTEDIVAYYDRPRWSPDGQRIVFAAQKAANGPIDIWVVDAQGTGIRPLTRDDEVDRAPTWSPDGRWIAWSRTTSGQRQIWVMAADGTGARPLLVGDSGEQLDLQGWAPDPG